MLTYPHPDRRGPGGARRRSPSGLGVVRARTAQGRQGQEARTRALTAAQRQELAPLVTLVDEVMKGATPGTVPGHAAEDPPKDAKDAKAPRRRPRPATSPLTWRNDFLKAQQG